MYCVLIDHPHEGVILWETGCGVDYPEVWGPQLADVFSRVRYEPKHELKAAVEATGHKLEGGRVVKLVEWRNHVDSGLQISRRSSSATFISTTQVGWTSFCTGKMSRSGSMTRS